MPRENGRPFQPLHAGLRLANVVRLVGGMTQDEMEGGIPYLTDEEARQLKDSAHLLNQAANAIHLRR